MIQHVTAVIDGDTFEVSPGWEWKGEKGNRIRPTGYDTPEKGTPAYDQMKRKLEELILNKDVVIKNVVDIDRGRLVCEVYIGGKNLADFFPEYKK